MVVIRLTRVGKKKQAHYRIVVADSRKAVQAKFISILGWYNPHTKELQVKQDELKAWFDKGAKPSNTLAKLLKAHKIDLPKWVTIAEKNKKSKQKEPDAAKALPGKEAEAKPEEGAEVETSAEEVGTPTSNVADAAESKTDEVEGEATSDVAEEEKTEETEETKEEPAEPDVASSSAKATDDKEAMPDKEVKEEAAEEIPVEKAKPEAVEKEKEDKKES